ncbi:elg1p, partial [Lasius niger]
MRKQTLNKILEVNNQTIDNEDEMEFKNQLEALSEEESILLKRIDKRIKMQSMIKKRQERLNILHRLAGEMDDETTPLEAEIDELSKIEQKRTAKVSKKIFLALQAENIKRTFHQVAKLEDKDGTPVHDVDC